MRTLSGSRRLVARGSIVSGLLLLGAAFATQGFVASPLGSVRPARAGTDTVVSIEFDDGYASQYQTLAKLNAHAMHGTYYIISGQHGMSWSQIHDLAHDGNEIGGHTITHPNLTTLSTADATHEVCDGRSQLIAQGFDVTNFAYPYGKNNASVQQIVKNCGYSSGRGVTGIISPEGCGGPCPYAETIPPLNPYATRTPQNVDEDTPLSEIEGFVTQAENHGGGWVQLVFHDICSPGPNCDYYSIPPAEFDTLLDWLQPRAANGTVVQTVAQVMGSSSTPPPAPNPPPAPTGPYAPVVVGDSPAGYWRLDDSNSTAADSAGDNPGIYSGATRGAASLLPADPADRAAGFSGANQYVRVPSASELSPSSQVSVEAWIKPTSLPATGAFRSVATKAESYSLQFNGPRLEFTIIQGGTRRRLQAPTGAIVAGTKYQVVGTYNGSTQRLYVNGVLVASAALTGAINANTNNLTIGSWNGSQEFFAGTIDEVAVYATALSSGRVSAHYLAGSGGAPAATSTLTVSTAGSGNGTVTSSPGGINCGGTCSASFNNGTGITLTAAAAGGSSFTGWSGGGCSGTGTCNLTLNADAAVTATFAALAPPTGYPQTVLADSPVGYWRLEETSGTTAANSVAPSGAGTYQGVTLGVPGLLATASDKAVTFSGANSRVQIASNAALSPSTQVTAEAWIKPSTLPLAGAFNSIVTKAESYSLQFNGPRLEFTIMQNGTRRRLQAPQNAIVAGTTYHVVGTYDGTIQRLYINGAQVASAALTGAITTNTNSLYIGSWNGSSEFFRGTVDEVAVYGTALTAGQISNHRSAGLAPS